MDLSKLFELAALAARIPSRSKPPTRSNTFSDITGTVEEATSLPRLPTEIFERIIDFLHTDKSALISCSTVCRSWFPTSRYHLYNLPVIPVALGDFDGCTKVNTAAALEGGTILYGTNDGIYSHRDGALVRLVKMPAVSQIEVLEAQGMLFFLSGRTLMVVPLRFATGPPNPPLFARRLSSLSTKASFFKVGTHAGRPAVCIVTTGPYNTQFKLMHAVAGAQDDDHRLQAYRAFYLPDRTRSVHIGNRVIGAALRAGFQCVDPLTLATFPVPVVPVQRAEDSQCRVMFRVSERFLLCYDRCAFYMDKAGVSSEGEFAIRWPDSAKQFALAPPYLLAFTLSGLHAWHIESGACVQSVRGGGIRLLATEPRVIVQMGPGDGRVLALAVR
ncbi:CNH domain-containing protein [Mycena galericulata]|nr:CNH domain-containing protein [Mycena galericulata]